MNTFHHTIALAAVAVLCTISAGAETRPDAEPVPSFDPYANETTAERDARMAWWRDAKFGMFIHWGVYAVPAGTYKGQQINGIGEWIMLKGEIPVAEYKAFAPKFTASKYDPAAWAALAKRAGMRYMVITAKHHEGFALFDSKVTDWDAVDASGAKRDLIAPLADAARAEGLKFGLYYSQAQDWNHPGGAKAGKWKKKEGGGWDPAHMGDFDQYLDQIAVPQVGEILAAYRPDILWWDTPAWMTQERAARLEPLLRIVPGIITNNRLGGGFKGDTETPEQHIPATGFADRDWEVCMTMNGTWGYKSYDHNWKSTEDLIRKLCDIVSKGGNFLLNVGPNAEGEIPQPSIERLEAIGRWMDVNGEAIYGTTASPFHKLPWGRCTKKMAEQGATLYLHIFDWPKDGKLVVPGLHNQVVSASLLAGHVNLEAARANDGVILQLPGSAPDPIVSVVKLEVAGALDIDPIVLKQAADGSIALNLAFTEFHNPGYGSKAKLEEKGGKTNIGFWTDARSWVGWTFTVDKPGTFIVAGEYAGGPSAVQWGLDGKTERFQFESTDGSERFKPVELGRVSIDAAGTQHLSIKPVKKGWKSLNLRSLTLIPVDE